MPFQEISILPTELFTTTSSVVVVSDAAGNILWANPAFMTRFGYSPDQLQRMDPPPFFSPEHHQEFSALMQKAAAGCSPDPFVIPITHSDSTVSQVHWTTLRLPDPSQGFFVAALGIAIEKSATPMDLGASEKQFRMLFDDSNISMTLIGEDMTILLMNKEFEKVTGYAKSQLEGKMPWTKFITDPEDLARMKEFHRLRRISPGLAPEVYNARIMNRTGEIRDVMMRVTMVPGTSQSLVTLYDMTERNLSEETLRESEEKYRTLVENMQDTLYRSDLQGNLTFVTPSGARLLGYESAAEMIGLNIAQSLYQVPAEREKLLKTLQTDGKVTGYEAVLKRKDGRPVSVVTNSQFLYDKTGKVIGVEGVLADITERKQSEKKLRENEERLRGITKNIPGAICQFLAMPSGEWLINYASERLTELFQLPANLETLFPDAMSFMHEEDREGFIASLRKAQKTVSTWDFEGRFLLSSGNSIWFHGLATPTPRDDGLVFDGLLLNITDRKQAEEALRKSEQLFRGFVENASDLIFGSDREGVLTYLSPNWQLLMGEPAYSAVGRLFTSYVHPEDASICRDVFNRILQTGNPAESLDFRAFHRDGSIRWFSIKASWQSDENGRIIGFMGIARDITERKHFEEVHRKLERQLFQSQKMDAIGQLAGGLAHDFNNILTGIQGNAVLMQMQFGPEHPHYLRLARIEEQVKRGANLTRQLLGFARGGKYEVKTICLNDLIRKIAPIFFEPRKEIEPEYQLEESVFPVEADPGQIEQVLLNLLINAGQAMPKGGGLRIQTTNLTLFTADTAHLEIKPGDYVRVAISDTGIGMTGETLKRVFEPFFTTKSRDGGTGLGLASAYGIIRNHGGAISVYSEFGYGSTFNMFLPSSAKKKLEEHLTPESPLFTGNESILLVEDEPAVLEATMELLTGLGYTVIKASSGQEAISIFQDRLATIDLVILDMILPGMSGAHVFQQLRSLNPEVKVILSSGYGLQGQVRNVMESGCRRFIQKPYCFSELSAAVYEVLHDPPPPAEST